MRFLFPEIEPTWCQPPNLRMECLRRRIVREAVAKITIVARTYSGEIPFRKHLCGADGARAQRVIDSQTNPSTSVGRMEDWNCLFVRMQKNGFSRYSPGCFLLPADPSSAVGRANVRGASTFPDRVRTMGGREVLRSLTGPFWSPLEGSSGSNPIQV